MKNRSFGDDDDKGWLPSDEEPDDLDEGDEEEVPRVIVGLLSDLNLSIAAKEYGPRPVWFLADRDNDIAGVFDRLPEAPMPEQDVRSILAAIRTFSVDHSEDMQYLLGSTDSIRYAFHTSASLKDVVTSFEDDGFDVLSVLKDGQIRIEDPDQTITG